MQPSTFSLRRELTIALAVLGVSVVVLPGVIYIVGMRLFGAYGGGMGKLYLDTLTDLSLFKLPAWIVVFAPLLCVLLLRWLVHLTRAPAAPEPRATRHEPRLGG